MSQSLAPVMEGHCVIGVDFGTLSARAVLVDARTGEELHSIDEPYRHGVIDGRLGGAALPSETALQDPNDYLAALRTVVRKVVRRAGVKGREVASIGIDFTSCTVLPVRGDGTPLCAIRKWRKNPHAWVKLWKHHTPQPQADRINEVGRERNEEFIRVYGGAYSSEWFFSKVLEAVQEAPEVYQAADRFLEAGDWIVWRLCGEERRALSAAGFKAMRVYPDDGGDWTFPSTEFFRHLDPRLENVVKEKLARDYLPVGGRAGGLTDSMAAELGLSPGTAVAAASIDAHSAALGCGVTSPGKLVMILGTSTCHLFVGDDRKEIEGICGVVRHGIVPGAWAYEAGQPAVGDMLGWHVRQTLDGAGVSHRKEAALHAALEKEAAKLAPGESGLLALDWWNGNRSVLADSGLSGALIGLGLSTKSHEIYRALIEGSAFGARKIVETFEKGGLPIRELIACGGLAKKNRLFMQIYADVMNREIRVAPSEQASALGAAVQAAAAAKLHPDVETAAKAMVIGEFQSYKPSARCSAAYQELYQLWQSAHDYFGRERPEIMKRLKSWRR